MIKIIPVALSLVLTLGAAAFADSSLNNAPTKSSSSAGTTLESDFDAQSRSDINPDTSASFVEEGFVMIVH